MNKPSEWAMKQARKIVADRANAVGAIAAANAIASGAMDDHEPEILEIARAIDAALAEGERREREATCKKLDAAAFAIEEDERDRRNWGGPDPRGENAGWHRLEIARALRSEAAAIRRRGE